MEKRRSIKRKLEAMGREIIVSVRLGMKKKEIGSGGGE